MDLERFLKKIQSADEPSKRRWLMVSTVIVMVFVVLVWLKYFNTLIAPQYESAKEPKGEFSLGESVKSGVALLYNSFWDVIDSVGENIQELQRK